MADTQIIRLPSVEEFTGRPRSSIYEDIRDGVFPPPVKIGKRAVGWTRNECAAINAARIAGKSRDEIRSLVANMVAARRHC